MFAQYHHQVPQVAQEARWRQRDSHPDLTVVLRPVGSKSEVGGGTLRMADVEHFGVVGCLQDVVYGFRGVDDCHLVPSTQLKEKSVFYS